MSDNATVRQCLSLVDFAKPLSEDLSKKILNLFTDKEIVDFSRLILTGNGDSYIAGVAAKPAFEKFTKYYSIDATPTIEVENHFDESKFANGTPLAIGISISGRAGGTVKAIRHCKELGAYTLGITEKVESPLGTSVDRILRHDAAEVELAPGTKTYFASVMTLLLLALRMGVAFEKITPDKAEELKGDIIEYVESFRPLIPTLVEQTQKIAEKFKNCDTFEMVGSGIDFSAAWFTRAKIYEAIGYVTTMENFEDWCHVNYYNARPTTVGAVVFISKCNPALSKAMEVIKVACEMDRPLVVITDMTKDEIPYDCEVITIPSAKHEWMIPIMQSMPATMLTGFLTNTTGQKPFREMKGPWGVYNANKIYADDFVPDHMKALGVK